MHRYLLLFLAAVHYSHVLMPYFIIRITIKDNTEAFRNLFISLNRYHKAYGIFPSRPIYIYIFRHNDIFVVVYYVTFSSAQLCLVGKSENEKPYP